MSETPKNNISQNLAITLAVIGFCSTQFSNFISKSRLNPFNATIDQARKNHPLNFTLSVLEFAKMQEPKFLELILAAQQESGLNFKDIYGIGTIILKEKGSTQEKIDFLYVLLDNDEKTAAKYYWGVKSLLKNNSLKWRDIQARSNEIRFS